MSDPTGEVMPAADQATTSTTCAQCATSLAPGEAVAAGDRFFCRSCYASLRAELEAHVAAMSIGVNYWQAGLGAVLGGAVGALAWWGFTVMTNIAFGLFAVAIGYLVGHGTVRFAGGRRSTGLQILSVVVALVSYACATYLVNMTFINTALAGQGASGRVGFPPASLGLFIGVVSVDVGLMDLVFLAIVAYESWRIPKAVALPPPATT